MRISFFLVTEMNWHTSELNFGLRVLDLTFNSLMFLKCQPVQEPEKMTQIIVEALEKTGQRGIINKGWGGLGNCKFLVP